MKNLASLLVASLISATAFSQVGVGTTTPNSTLDVRGSVSTNYRAFTTSTTAATTDAMLAFTGTSAATLTLPTAATTGGRYYWIKNASSNSSVLTIATTSSQTIDGASSWTLDVQNEAVRLVSNGANWYVVSEVVPGSTGTSWLHNGNAVGATRTLGTTTNYDLPIITNNTEKMRITNTGYVGIGTSTFNGSNPEKLLVDAGTTTSYNVISGKGTINNYLQLNIQNNSSGNSASADVVATANNGNESVNYVDLGINSSTYNVASFNVTGANDAYLYSTGNDFAIGNATSNKVLKFFTGGTVAANERMRINQNGNVAIGSTTFDGSNPERLLVDNGTSSSLNIIRAIGNTNGIIRQTLTNQNAGNGAGSDFRMYNDADNSVVLGLNSTGYSGSSIYSGAADAQLYSAANDFVIGNTIANKNLRFYTGGIATTNERMRINGVGNVAIGATAFNATNPEKLLVDAGTTTSYNVISGKGSINSYLQLNIQNTSTGTTASSDIVATANNGTESTDFVNLGINGSGNTSTGVLGGSNTAYLYATGEDFVIGNGTNDAELRFFTTTGSTSTERMRLDGTTGNLGVGTTAPAQKFHVSGGNARITNGGINADIMVGTTFAGITNASGIVYYEVGGDETHMFGGQVIPDADGSRSLGIASRRWQAVYAANGTIQTSDVRLKKNILPLTYGLNEVIKLEPVSYDWKDNSGTHKVGLIAQEVRKIIPEVVVGDESKESIGMNYAELVPVLVNAIKELNTELINSKAELQKSNDQLKKDNATSKDMITELKTQLEQLKKEVEAIRNKK